MDHNDAFSKDILAHPEDDAPRLIYADWLSEQDDRAALTRAEFIRVQYALEDLPPGDLRRVALEDRQRDILLTHEQEWTAGVRQLGLSECHFRRGFIEGLSLHPRRLVSVGERLRERVPLREARLRNWERYAYAPSAWADWETFAELDVLSQLTGLDLTDYSNLDAATASSLFHAGGLRRLQ